MHALYALVGMLTLCSLAAGSAHASGFEGRPTVADGELDRVRGGFLLPNGMDVGLGITVDTLIDGRAALSTVLTIEDAARLSVYSSGKPATPTSATTLLVPVPGGSSFVRITQDAPSAAEAGGREPVLVSAGGPPVQTPWGAIQLTQAGNQATVSLVGDGIELRHMIGPMTGAMIANTVNDRVIDTMMTVDVDIRNSAIPVAAMALRLDGLLADAAALRAR
jgi:hypothetical protein